MPLTSLERAAKLKQEADELLDTIKLAELCRGIGPMTPTGSYYLDVMVYPDIDVYLPPARPRQLFEVVSHLTEHHPVVRVNFLNQGMGPLKDGRYIKPVIDVGNWGRPWKIDIWAVDQAFIDQKQAELDDLKARMTMELRTFILGYKYSILNEEGRTPMYSGIHIYRGVLDHGLRTHGELSDYLRQQGIAV
ncbi:MAG: hypothetical protein P8046_00385 [Anaerolineales bacterium]|jgi:hypothetical protein